MKLSLHIVKCVSFGNVGTLYTVKTALPFYFQLCRTYIVYNYKQIHLHSRYNIKQ